MKKKRTWLKIADSVKSFSRPNILSSFSVLKKKSEQD